MAAHLDLTGKTILVTGASSGIGRATAVACSRQGGKILLAARNQNRLDETLSSLEGDGHTVEPIDLAHTDELPAWMKSLATSHGPLHGVAHCAGAQWLAPLQIMKSKPIEQLLRLNVVSALMIAKGFRQKDVHAGSASLVFVSSVMGSVGSIGRSAYCASKGALHALTKALALELARDHIRVNCVAPGFVETEMMESTQAQVGTAQMDAVAALHPLGMGSPKQVAQAICFLLTDHADWTTGAIHTVDGGYTSQ